MRVVALATRRPFRNVPFELPKPVMSHAALLLRIPACCRDNSASSGNARSHVGDRPIVIKSWFKGTRRESPLGAMTTSSRTIGPIMRETEQTALAIVLVLLSRIVPVSEIAPYRRRHTRQSFPACPRRRCIRRFRRLRDQGRLPNRHCGLLRDYVR